MLSSISVSNIYVLDQDEALEFYVGKLGLEVRDIHGLQERLLQRGVAFAAKAERQDWGGIRARILDPDGNRYMIYEMARATRGPRAR